MFGLFEASIYASISCSIAFSVSTAFTGIKRTPLSPPGPYSRIRMFGVVCLRYSGIVPNSVLT